MNCGPKSTVQFGNFYAVRQACREPTRGNLEVSSSNGGEAPVDGRAKAALPLRGVLRDMPGENFSCLGFHGATVAGGAHLQFALHGFVEFADDNGCHEMMLAQEC